MDHPYWERTPKAQRSVTLKSFGDVTMEVTKILSLKIDWENVSILPYCEIGQKDKNYDNLERAEDYLPRFAIVFASNVDDYDDVELSLGQVNDLAKLCDSGGSDLEGVAARWLWCPDYDKSFFKAFGVR